MCNAFTITHTGPRHYGEWTTINNLLALSAGDATSTLGKPE